MKIKISQLKKLVREAVDDVNEAPAAEKEPVYKKMIRVAYKASSDVIDLRKTQNYGDLEAMSVADLTDQLQQAEAARGSINAALDEVMGQSYDDIVASDHNVEEDIGQLDNRVREIEDFIANISDALEVAGSKEASKKALADAGLKPATAADMAKIYKAAKSEYSSSDIMMIDDAMRGAESVAKKLGYGVYTDGGFFPDMFQYIKANRRWDDVKPDAVERMVDAANEDLEFEAKRRGKKKIKKSK